MAARDFTLESYRRHAEAFARKFDAIAHPDVADVFSRLGKARPRVLEIGFGGGRDGAWLAASGADYRGVDFSPELVALARAKYPGVRFDELDVRTGELPGGNGLVLALASLVHLPRAQLEAAFAKVRGSLVPGGIFALSLRRAPRYRKEIRSDDFGSRREFYFFNEAAVRKLAASVGLDVGRIEAREFGGGDWWFLELRRAG